MQLLLHRSASMAGGSGGRALRRVDSYPGRPALCRSDSIKKKRSKRARLSAALRELRLAAKARDKDGLLQILVTGHRRRRGSGPGVDSAGGSTSTGLGVASTVDADADQRAAPGRRHRGAGAGPLLELERPDEGITGRRRCPSSWALAVALVLALACVVALGKAPAICCCTCAAAWWSAGDRAQGQASAGSACRRRSGARGSSVTGVAQQQAAASSTSTSTVSYRGRQWVIS